MLRSMYSGISGMKVNQIKLDVIGNNIANVGTTGFKSSRARFSDMLNQNVTDAMAPSQNQGGVNASQVGLGVQLASIDAVMTQGNMQPTGRALDVGIDGDGFFMVSKGPVINGNELEVNHRPGTHSITDQSLANSGSELMYSRDGSFILDNEGNLLTGDGYRVMGYSLTNDDSSMTATSKNPTPVSAAGLDFRFGPGSQLNGYKVVLGAIGPQTPTTADVDKAQKLIILNGDFSTPGGLTTQQVESAINKGLSANGISQSIYVSGNPVNIADLGSEGVKGGSDATAPGALSFAGFTLQFSEGSELNGYTLEVGNVSHSGRMNASVDPDNKVITVNGNFVDKNSITGEGLKNAINEALTASGVKQTVTNVTGSPINLAQIYAQTDKGSAGKAPTIEFPSGVTDGEKDTYLAGFKVTLGSEASQELNGYQISFKESTNVDEEVSVDISGKDIIIKGGKNKLDTILATDLTTKVNDKLDVIGKGTVELTFAGSYEAANKSNKVKITGGEDPREPKSVDLGGFTIAFDSKGVFGGSPFDDMEFVIGDINAETGVTATIDPKNPKKMIISGNFKGSPGVLKEDLEYAINDALSSATPKIDGTVKVSGQNKVYSGVSSAEIEGGDDLKSPGTIQAAGLVFEPMAGGKLNGYKIQIGQVTAGTKTNAVVDEKQKTIIINADFVTENAVNAKSIQNAVNKALTDKGINQNIIVSGSPMTLSGTESEETLGGTPVQSISEDGVVNFVDGTKDLKSYDGNLKSLKIPDKVRIPGTDTELRVKTYTIDSTGVINGVLEDGRVAALGQIAMASFKNPEGLTKMGGNLYSSSVNSGNPILKSGVGTLGEDNSQGYGDNLQGMLEMSNVDLAEQYTDMIASSRAFQASGKMITTGDEILQDIINLKR